MTSSCVPYPPLGTMTSLSNQTNGDLDKCVKLAWSLGFDLFRVRKVARARIWVVVALGLGYGLV